MKSIKQRFYSDSRVPNRFGVQRSKWLRHPAQPVLHYTEYLQFIIQQDIHCHGYAELHSILGLGLEGQVVKFIDITNFFSYTYYTDHKNGYSRPESRNLD